MRRLSAAVRMIVNTLVNVVTLPFRVLARLLSPSRRSGR